MVGGVKGTIDALRHTTALGITGVKLPFRLTHSAGLLALRTARTLGRAYMAGLQLNGGEEGLWWH